MATNRRSICPTCMLISEKERASLSMQFPGLALLTPGSGVQLEPIAVVKCINMLIVLQGEGAQKEKKGVPKGNWVLFTKGK